MEEQERKKLEWENKSRILKKCRDEKRNTVLSLISDKSKRHVWIIEVDNVAGVVLAKSRHFNEEYLISFDDIREIGSSPNEQDNTGETTWLGHSDEKGN